MADGGLRQLQGVAGGSAPLCRFSVPCHPVIAWTDGAKSFPWNALNHKLRMVESVHPQTRKGQRWRVKAMLELIELPPMESFRAIVRLPNMPPRFGRQNLVPCCRS